jgi:hypothetical protein
MEQTCVVAVRKRDLVLSLLGGLAVGLAGVALAATRVYAGWFSDWDVFWFVRWY